MWLAGRSSASATKAVDQLKSEGLPVEPVTLDVTKASQIAAVAADIRSRLGHLDILVNNAGVLLDVVAFTHLGKTLPW